MQTRFLLALLLSALPAAAQRIAEELSDGWRFDKSDAGLQADASGWTAIRVPHTWNAFDAQDGITTDPNFARSNNWQPEGGFDLKAVATRNKEGYHRGPCWYARTIELPAAQKGRRVFLRFEAASTVAEVWLNGRRLGEHRGAFTAFAFEITPLVAWDRPNDLRVRVDNSTRPDVPPLSGDFNLFGGLYRPVHLLITDPVCVTPLEAGSPGVFVSVPSLSDSEGVVSVRSLISNGTASPAPTVVRTTVRDAAGRTLARTETALEVTAGTTAPIAQQLSVPSPHRWHGRTDPYLHRVVVEVVRAGVTVDRVEQPLGFRTIAITEADGFLLNGRPYALHGVNRHQDLRDRGWALSPADHKRDFALIREIGATALRLAHYPQAELVYDLADRDGLVVWHEVSLVNNVTDSPAFRANAEEQLRELVLQHYNHPSVAFLGLFNEIHRPDAATALPLIQRLAAVVRELDPARISVAASFIAGQAVDQVPDRLACNAYPGWYGGTPEDLTGAIRKYSDSVGGKQIGVSEYGAGANPLQHVEGLPPMTVHRSHWHPEEYQALIHESAWTQIKDNPRVWGSFVWAMFDFASDTRNEGAIPGVNNKGLVTQDRSLRKDAFYFYKANWNPEPQVYIAERRSTPRRLPETTVKVYTNLPEVELRVNGESAGRARPDEIRIARFTNIRLRPGDNRIEVVAPGPAGSIRDECTWHLDAATPTQ